MNKFLKLLREEKTVEMTGVNRERSKSRGKENLKFHCASLVWLEAGRFSLKLPFRYDSGRVVVLLVANFAGIKIPRTSHPSSEAVFVYKS
jgi:hypothetical protein